MSNQKPVFVLVQGAWHQPAHLTILITALESHSYTAHAVALPSCSLTVPGPPNALTLDINAVRTAVAEQVTHLSRDVVLVCHSYGGFPGSRAFRGLTKTDRGSQGLAGGVVCLAMLNAFNAPPGLSLRDVKSLADGHPDEPDYWPPEWLLDEKHPDTVIHMEDPVKMFFLGLGKEDQDEAVRMLLPLAKSAFTQPLPQEEVEWEKIRVRYQIGGEDKAVPVEGQEAVVQIMRGMGAEVEIERVSGAGHSAFLTHVEETVGFLRRAAGEKV